MEFMRSFWLYAHKPMQIKKPRVEARLFEVSKLLNRNFLCLLLLDLLEADREDAVFQHS